MIPEKEPRCESPVRLREQEPEVRQLHQAPPWLGIQGGSDIPVCLVLRTKPYPAADSAIWSIFNLKQGFAFL